MIWPFLRLAAGFFSTVMEPCARAGTTRLRSRAFTRFPIPTSQVIYRNWLTGGGDPLGEAPLAPAGRWLAAGGLARVVCGHQPHRDLPLCLRLSPNDGPYSGGIDDDDNDDDDDDDNDGPRKNVLLGGSRLTGSGQPAPPQEEAAVAATSRRLQWAVTCDTSYAGGQASPDMRGHAMAEILLFPQPPLSSSRPSSRALVRGRRADGRPFRCLQVTTDQYLKLARCLQLASLEVISECLHAVCSMFNHHPSTRACGVHQGSSSRTSRRSWAATHAPPPATRAGG